MHQIRARNVVLVGEHGLGDRLIGILRLRRVDRNRLGHVVPGSNGRQAVQSGIAVGVVAVAAQVLGEARHVVLVSDERLSRRGKLDGLLDDLLQLGALVAGRRVLVLGIRCIAVGGGGD